MIKMFSAPWCTYCNIMKDNLTEEDLEGVEILNVDEHPNLKEKYGIRTIPAFVKLDEDGEEVDRRIGSMTRENFLAFKNG